MIIEIPDKKTLVEDLAFHCPYCGGNYAGLHLVDGFYMCWKCAADQIIQEKKELEK